MDGWVDLRIQLYFGCCSTHTARHINKLRGNGKSLFPPASETSPSHLPCTVSFYRCLLIFARPSFPLLVYGIFWSLKQHHVRFIQYLLVLSRTAGTDDGITMCTLSPQRKRTTTTTTMGHQSVIDWCSATSTSFSVIFIIQLLLNQLLKVIKWFIMSVSITGSLTAADYNQ